MGNNICSICGRKQSTDRNYEVNLVVHNNEEEIESAKIIQVGNRCAATGKTFESDRIREIMDNIIHFGKYLTEQEMSTAVHEKVKAIEAQIGGFHVTDHDKMKFDISVFENGAFRFNDGSIYRGQWNLNAKKHGYGEYIRNDGSKYVGFWQNDKAEGRGRYIDINGNYYEGEWKDGNAHGNGSMVLTTGAKYTGHWVDDLQDGYGEEIFPDGTSYKGTYKKGQKHGKGKFTWSDGSCYDGDFHYSTICGNGTLKWNDGRMYFGEWLDNRMHGEGEFYWPDGKKYKGEYQHDKKEGKGTYYWSPEKYYSGEWLNSKQHGEGVLYNKGKILKGKFRFGKLIKKYNNFPENGSNLDRSENFTKQIDSYSMNGEVATLKEGGIPSMSQSISMNILTQNILKVNHSENNLNSPQ